MSIGLDWLSRDFPTETAARRRINEAIGHVWRVLRKHFGDAVVGSDAELLAVQADWFVVFARLSPESCRLALAEAIVLDDCPSLADFEALARAHLAVPVVMSDGANERPDASISSVAEALPVVSDGVNTSGVIPPGKADGGNSWAWRLESLRAARHLVHFFQRGGMALVHRSAVEFHLTQTGKLRRDEKGALRVNEGAFVT